MKETYPRGLERLVWSILLSGLLIAIALLCTGLIWEWMFPGDSSVTPPISATNLAGYLLITGAKALDMGIGPAIMIYTGIGVLLLTPLARVLASFLFFIAVDRDWKFTAITGFACAVLAYVLFIR
jgi:uncharacterized membrane protein